MDVDAFREGLLEWRNTTRSSGRSPAQELYGKPLQSFLLAHRRSFAPEWQTKATTMDTFDTEPSEEDNTDVTVTARPLSRLKLGSQVDIQDPRTKMWSKRGVIVGIGDHRDYYVKLPSGRVWWPLRLL